MTPDPDLPPEDGDADERPDPLDVDAAFAAIVAAWESESGSATGGTGGTGAGSAESVARWPVVEDLGPDDADTPTARDTSEPEPERVDKPEVWRKGPDPLEDPPYPTAPSGREEIGLSDDPYDRFEPPEPPPIPRGDPVLRLAWAGVLGGPLFLLIYLFVSRPLPVWAIAVGVGGFVAGFAVLVARMPDHREDDDDGAVV